jgi:hypothetical protein
MKGYAGSVDEGVDLMPCPADNRAQPEQPRQSAKRLSAKRKTGSHCGESERSLLS